MHFLCEPTWCFFFLFFFIDTLLQVDSGLSLRLVRPLISLMAPLEMHCSRQQRTPSCSIVLLIIAWTALY